MVKSTTYYGKFSLVHFKDMLQIILQAILRHKFPMQCNFNQCTS